MEDISMSTRCSIFSKKHALVHHWMCICSLYPINACSVCWSALLLFLLTFLRWLVGIVVWPRHWSQANVYFTRDSLENKTNKTKQNKTKQINKQTKKQTHCEETSTTFCNMKFTPTVFVKTKFYVWKKQELGRTLCHLHGTARLLDCINQFWVVSSKQKKIQIAHSISCWKPGQFTHVCFLGCEGNRENMTFFLYL